MIISVHIGAHCTNGQKLVHTLLKNRPVLAEAGARVPGPASYRVLLPEAMHKVRAQPASAESQSGLIEALTDAEPAERIVLSHEDAICQPGFILEGGRLYGKAHYKLPWLRNVFAGHPMELHLGIRNPATLIPDVFELCGPQRDYAGFIGDTDLRALRWSDTIALIREACPDVALTVWAFEDTPLTWTQVLRELGGLGPEVPVTGGLDILAEIMQREGMKRLRSYLKTHVPKTEAQRRRILAAFLDKYVDEGAVETEIDLPGWDDALVGAMTATYERDLERIARMGGVRFIAP